VGTQPGLAQQALRWVAAHSDIDITGELGALAVNQGSDFDYWTALAGQPMDASGDAYAEFTCIRSLSDGSGLLLGVATAGYDAAGADKGVRETAHGWMYDCYNGNLRHDAGDTSNWASGGGQRVEEGETVGLRLQYGCLSAYKDGALLGVLCAGLSGRLVWAADMGSGASVRIAPKPTPESEPEGLGPEPVPEPEPALGVETEAPPRKALSTKMQVAISSGTLEEVESRLLAGEHPDAQDTSYQIHLNLYHAD
jgi:hypothetical protein